MTTKTSSKTAAEAKAQKQKKGAEQGNKAAVEQDKHKGTEKKS